MGLSHENISETPFFGVNVEKDRDNRIGEPMNLILATSLLRGFLMTSSSVAALRKIYFTPADLTTEAVNGRSICHVGKTYKNAIQVKYHN
jgi:hypothetical protein